MHDRRGWAYRWIWRGIAVAIVAIALARGGVHRHRASGGDRRDGVPSRCDGPGSTGGTGSARRTGEPWIGREAFAGPMSEGGTP